MTMKLTFLVAVLSTGFFTTSCSHDVSGYGEVSYGGQPYWLDHHGHYYHRYWYGYRPCPKPPGKPDHPHKPTHPIEKPGNPGRPSTQPINDRPSVQPVTRPSSPSTRPSYQPMPRMHGGRGRR